MTQHALAGPIRLAFIVMAISISRLVMMMRENTSLHTEGILTRCVDTHLRNQLTNRHVQASRRLQQLHSQLVWHSYRAVACLLVLMIVDLQGNLVGGLAATQGLDRTLDKQVARVAHGELLRHES